jgi:hypothetical protein
MLGHSSKRHVHIAASSCMHGWDLCPLSLFFLLFLHFVPHFLSTFCPLPPSFSPSCCFPANHVARNRQGGKILWDRSTKSVPKGEVTRSGSQTLFLILWIGCADEWRSLSGAKIQVYSARPHIILSHSRFEPQPIFRLTRQFSAEANFWTDTT